MLDLQRTAFCNLVGIEVVQLRSLDGRGLLPFGVDQTTTGRGYSFGEGLLFMLMAELTQRHSIGMARASEIAARLPPALDRRWADVIRTARLLSEGTGEPVREILGGRVSFPYPHQPIAVCGTGKQIEADVAATGLQEIGSLRISASRVLSRLITRARAQDQKIPADFWSGPLKYRPKPSFITPAEIADALEEKK